MGHYFSVLDIDIADSSYLFDMLDLDGSNEVDMEEFVTGCLRLKGNAKSIDIHVLMFEIKTIMSKFEAFVETLQGNEDDAKKGKRRKKKPRSIDHRQKYEKLSLVKQASV